MPPPSGDYHWVYLWEWPIRAMHWLAALSILILAGTGLYIGRPYFVTSGDTSAHFLMGWIRFAPFRRRRRPVATAIVRFYWLFAGNKYERWPALFPIRPRDWVNLFKQVKYYLMIQPEKAPHYLGHNPLQQLSYTAIYGLALLQVVTGFALYGQSNPGGFFFVPSVGSGRCSAGCRSCASSTTWRAGGFSSSYRFTSIWRPAPTSSSGAARSLPLSAAAGSCVRSNTSSMSEPGCGGILVIGLGNPLMADDGLGLAALERLRQRWRLPESVRLVDGGTWGMNLLPLIEEAERVVFLDAIDAGRPAGSLVELEREELPRLFAHKLSAAPDRSAGGSGGGRAAGHAAVASGRHRASARSAGDAFGLSPELECRLDEVLALLVERLERWGYASRRTDSAANA